MASPLRTPVEACMSDSVEVIQLIRLVSLPDLREGNSCPLRRACGPSTAGSSGYEALSLLYCPVPGGSANEEHTK